jgi:hypothetical protein
MPKITDYSSLQSNLASLLVRTDLTSDIPTFIQMAEADFKQDTRVRKLTNRGTVLISAETVTLPSDLVAIESWYHDGPTYFGHIDVVDANQLPQVKLQHGTTGPPQAAAFVGDSVWRTAPVADETFSTKMSYWRGITALSDTNTTNWVLTHHPNLYLYGAAMHAAPRLKDDTRIPMWERFLARAYDGLENKNEEEAFSGAVSRRYTPIG